MGEMKSGGGTNYYREHVGEKGTAWEQIHEILTLLFKKNHPKTKFDSDLSSSSLVNLPSPFISPSTSLAVHSGLSPQTNDLEFTIHFLPIPLYFPHNQQLSHAATYSQSSKNTPLFHLT
jgi:hypothetical protein